MNTPPTPEAQRVAEKICDLHVVTRRDIPNIATIIDEATADLRQQLGDAINRRNATADSLVGARGEVESAHDYLDQRAVEPPEGEHNLCKRMVGHLIKLDDELDQAEKARDELVGLKIQGKSLRDYLTEQFPATIGHVPLREYFDRLNTLLATLNAATREGE